MTYGKKEVGTTGVTGATGATSFLSDLLARFSPPLAPAVPASLTPTVPDPPSVPAHDPDAVRRLVDLRAYVDSLAHSRAWREAWNLRHKSPNGWESPVRVAGYILDDFDVAIGRGDLDSLDSRERFLRRMLSGDLFDGRPVARDQHSSVSTSAKH